MATQLKGGTAHPLEEDWQHSWLSLSFYLLDILTIWSSDHAKVA